MKHEKIFNAVFIADIHFGAGNGEMLFKELYEKFIYFLEHNPVDLIVIGGDLFHKKLSLNSVESKYLLLFMDILYRICEGKNIRLRIINGTLTHDFDQIKNFSYMIHNSDTKLIDKPLVEEITLNDGNINKIIKILYVPEEYVDESVKEYQKKLFPTKYDFVFGHGCFKFINFSKFIDESDEKHIKSSPIFDEDFFMENTLGVVMFGHIHSNINHKNKIFYPGSFSRFSFGEEHNKGFYYINYNYIKNEAKADFIINDLAPIFKTFKTTELLDSINEKDKIKALLDKIKILKTEYYKVRIINDSSDELMKEFLTKSFSNDDNVKINNRKVVKENERVLSDNLQKIVDGSVDAYDAIRLWLLEKNIVIEKSVIERLLSDTDE